MMADVIREQIKDNHGKGNVVVEPDIKIEKYESGGANYLSVLYKVTVTTADEEQHLFAKVTSFNDSMRENNSTDWIFHTEQYVYMKLAKIYDEIQERHAVPPQYRFIFPKLYGCNTEKGKETIVIEDLDARGYTSFDRFRPIDWEYASASVQTLARFHALSFAYEKERPEEFQRVTKEMESKLKPDVAPLSQIWGPMAANSLNVVKEENRDRVRKILCDTQLLNNYVKPVKKIVLAHGDYRLSNLLFKRQDDLLHVIPVDYQLFHSGCAPADLMYLISMGSDRQFRTKYFRKLVDYYYEQLTVALKRLSLDIDEVYPRDIFDIELKEILPVIIANGVMTLPAVTVDSDAAPEITDSFADFVMMPNDKYKERFNEIIDDCIEWGAI